jgi:TolA-binding protein
LTHRARAACALFLCVGCAGAGPPLREDLDGLRAEVRALRRENETLARKVDALSGRMDFVTARTRRPAEPRPAESAPAPPVVPPDLAVVKLAPRKGSPRVAPPVPTAVPVGEPDPAALDALARPSRRELSAEADAELAAARGRDGLDRAHALEDFTARYPRHGAADNALVDAVTAYAAAGREDAACRLARRIADDYPAGDAMSDALERLAACEARRNAPDAERRLLERLVREYPSTPAAERAGARLATISGSAGDSPRAVPARSGP